MTTYTIDFGSKLLKFSKKGQNVDGDLIYPIGESIDHSLNTGVTYVICYYMLLCRNGISYQRDQYKFGTTYRAIVSI